MTGVQTCALPISVLCGLGADGIYGPERLGATVCAMSIENQDTAAPARVQHPAEPSTLFTVLGWIWLIGAVFTPAVVIAVWAVAGKTVTSAAFKPIETAGIVMVAIMYGPVSFAWAVWVSYRRDRGWLLVSFLFAPIAVVVVTGIAMFAAAHVSNEGAAKGAWLPFFVLGAISGSIFFVAAIAVAYFTGSFLADRHDQALAAKSAD